MGEAGFGNRKTLLEADFGTPEFTFILFICFSASFPIASQVINSELARLLHGRLVPRILIWFSL